MTSSPEKMRGAGRRCSVPTGQERTAPSLYDFVEQVLRGKEGEEKR